MGLQLNVHLLGILCQIFGHDAAGSKVHLVNARFHLHATQKTKHSPKNIHETITQKIHKKTFTALLSGQLSTTTGMLCSILFGGITQADIFFMPLVSHEMVLHHMRFFQGHVKPLVQKDICCLTDSLGTVWWKINKGVN